MVSNEILTHLIGRWQFEEVQSVGIPLINDISQGLSFEGPAVAGITVHLLPYNKKPT